MEKKMYEVSCDDGYLVRSKDMDEVLRSAQAHMQEKHHEDMKLEEVRTQVHEVEVRD